MFTDLTAIHAAEFTLENQGMSADVINKAFLATEEEFLSLVRRQWQTKPEIASVGACCLVGVICSGLLYIANAGDSRVVLGRQEKAVKEIKAVQLSIEHNASLESVREELRSLHPDDPQIVVLKHKVWRVKGLIQVISWDIVVFYETLFSHFLLIKKKIIFPLLYLFLNYLLSFMPFLSHSAKALWIYEIFLTCMWLFFIKDMLLGWTKLILHIHLVTINNSFKMFHLFP